MEFKEFHSELVTNTGKCGNSPKWEGKPLGLAEVEKEFVYHSKPGEDWTDPTKARGVLVVPCLASTLHFLNTKKHPMSWQLVSMETVATVNVNRLSQKEVV